MDGQGRSALHYCSENKDTSCARLLLENDEIKSRILDLQDHEGCSALHLACMNGNESMVEFLCERGANVKLVDNESHSLIHWITGKTIFCSLFEFNKFDQFVDIFICLKFSWDIKRRFILRIFIKLFRFTMRLNYAVNWFMPI